MIMDDETLIEFVRDTLGVENATSETKLFSTGLLDSVSMVNLIAFMEQSIGMVVRPEDVTLDNFDTPRRILHFSQAMA